MALSKKKKIGLAIGLAGVGVGLLVVGVVSASRGSPDQLPPAPDDDEEDDADDDQDDDAPSAVDIPAGTMPPTMPIDFGPIIDRPQPIVIINPPQPHPNPPPIGGNTPTPDWVLHPPQPQQPPIVIQPPVGPPIQLPQFPVEHLPQLPINPPVIMQPAPAPALSPADAAGAAMVAELLEAEHSNGWKRHYDSVGVWQELAHRPKVDGMFGPGDALELALTHGTLPIIRYWPAASGANPKAALADYRNALLTIASTRNQKQAAELHASAQREIGQSFGPPVGTGGRGPAV